MSIEKRYASLFFYPKKKGVLAEVGALISSEDLKFQFVKTFRRRSSPFK
jgi:hypothetical protein